MGAGSTSARFRRCASIAIVLSLLAAGCVTGRSGDPPPGDEAVVEEGGMFGRLLPKPLGSVTHEDEPLVYALGWTGMIAGGLAGGTVVAVLVFRGEASGSGEALFAAVFAGGLVGAVVGGMVMTLPARGIEALWEMIFGSGDAPAGSG